MQDKRLKNANQVAKVCGVSPHTAAKWMACADFPKGREDSYDLSDVLAYAKIKIADSAEKQTGPNGDLKRTKLQRQCAKLAEDIRRSKADADIAEQKAKVNAGLLMPKADHQRRLGDLARLVKATLVGSKREIGALADNPALLKAYSDKVDSLLQTMADSCEKAGL